MWFVLLGLRFADDPAQVLPDLAAIGQFVAEVRRRVDGVDGVHGIVELYRRLTGALDVVSRAELERACADVASLRRRFEEAGRRLEQLAALKRSLGI